MRKQNVNFGLNDLRIFLRTLDTHTASRNNNGIYANLLTTSMLADWTVEKRSPLIAKTTRTSLATYTATFNRPLSAYVYPSITWHIHD